MRDPTLAVAPNKMILPTGSIRQTLPARPVFSFIPPRGFFARMQPPATPNAGKVATWETAMRFPFMLVAAALVAGCASQTASMPASAKVNLSGYPLEFRQGYADGCASVNAARKRDEARFKSDANYMQGWRDGNDICEKRK